MSTYRPVLVVVWRVLGQAVLRISVRSRQLPLVTESVPSWPTLSSLVSLHNYVGLIAVTMGSVLLLSVVQETLTTWILRAFCGC